MKILTLATTSALALIVGFGPALADRLDDIKTKGLLVCGTVPNYEPFSFPDPSTRQLVGYDVDFCEAIAGKLGVKFEMKTMSNDARIPELTEGRVDILTADLGYTLTRAEQINYSYGYFMVPHRVAVRADRGFADLKSLAGKRIAVIKGSTSEGFVRKSVENVNVVTFDDAPTGFLALVQGKVDGFSASFLVNARLISKAGDAAPLKLVDQAVGTETWGIGVRKGEDRLLGAVDKALVDLDNSGEAENIHDKWLGEGTIYKQKKSFKIEKIAN
ncbi:MULTISPECIES: ABC transporter substrate-binding protein [Rhizobium/Agrobacterium group]|uniref:ABC transporter substrate binding protein (Amino acid) n=2 Tax=Rhizobium/Agrobacterium group TaxID=227290 RepID=B9K3S2_ALLAM|nr:MULTISPECIES: ABC transporter substrate-binding protein [Rhizobium/Agrobacterium group]ACM39520.1 ABC transporter substrate binding protein (amino acid) [Allorhizobium ampelinum S4]MCF1448961.1 ABC transporter substrate-binding protein [Allorhizobium ampelinum]MUO31319.1 transporter substrate-binding domain-containing protein [Agrobacterium vitis]MUO44980.1 transporter substrate-binding domain-containing protein [Agrobacterium vitis]MUP13025.1 transporter substrate-binding domain-containing